MALKLFTHITPMAIFRIRPISNLFPIPPFTLSFSFSTTATRYPLYYEMVVSRPTQDSLRHPRRPRLLPSKSNPDTPPESSSSDLGFDDWVDKKIAANEQKDKAKRKYYSKTARRMYGTDSDDEIGRDEDGFVELQPEVVEMRTLHQREEELFFYDAFCYPWEKDKHYKMVYQLEKKYFPDHCLDKAFLEPGQVSGVDAKKKVKRTVKVKASGGGGVVRSETEESTKDGEDDMGMVFFENVKEKVGGEVKDGEKDVLGKKVEDFFKTLKRVPSKSGEVRNAEPYLLTRSTELPARWDGPNGTVVLVNKPKGWTSFTVCGKLRRLVKVQKVGHAGTLDPMATGLLIVCIGKATKVVDSYQGMIKSYSGVFRLGEATSTWDADSAVIQREPWEHIKDDDIQKTAKTFCGEIFQVPPMFSAIKVGGEKMYEKARRGESVELSPRRISIFKFDVERSLNDRQNLIFRVTCSKGTYIRSLCCDFGKALGSCAHLTALRRDSIGEYSADDAWEFKELEEAINKNFF